MYDLWRVTMIDTDNTKKVDIQNQYEKNKKMTRIVMIIMAIVMIACIGFIGYVLTGLNGKGIVVFNDLNNSQVDPYINEGKFNTQQAEATEMVTEIKDQGKVYGYYSESSIIIPDGLCTGTMSKISFIGMYLGKKGDAVMAAYQTGDSYYYYVSDELTEDELITFIKSQWKDN